MSKWRKLFSYEFDEKIKKISYFTAIGYVFPDEIQKISPDSQPQNNTNTAESLNPKSKSPDQDWQFVIPVPGPGEKPTADRIDADNLEFDANGFVSVGEHEAMNVNGSNSSEIIQVSGIFPAARARLASLRDLGAKKIGALKLKLIENKIKSTERGKM